MTLDQSPLTLDPASSEMRAPSPRRTLPLSVSAVLLLVVMLAAFLNTVREGALSPAFALMAVAVAAVLVLGAAPWFRCGRVELLMAVYLGWVLLSVVLPHRYQPVDPNDGSDISTLQAAMHGVVLPFGVYVAARVVLADRRRVRWLLWTVVGMTAYSAWVSVVQFHGPHGLVWPRFIVDAPAWPGRAVGVFNQPVTNGVLLDVGIAVCLLLLERGGLSRGWRVALGVVTAAATYAVYLTHTRAAVVGLVAVIVLGAVLARGWRRGFVAVGVLGVVTVASKGVSVLFTPDRAAGGFGAPDELYDRLNVTATMLAAIRDYPVFGVGLTRFAMYNYYEHTQWSPSVDWSRGQGFVSHENELGIAAEVGLAGLVLWVAVLVGIVVVLSRAVRTQPADELDGVPLALVAGIGLVVMVFTGFTVDLRILEFTTMLPFVLAGAAVGAWNRRGTPGPSWLRRLAVCPMAPPWRSVRATRWAVGAGLVVAVVAYVLAVQTAGGRRLDTGAMHAAWIADRSTRLGVRGVLAYGGAPLALILAVLLAVAYVRVGQRRAALQVGVVVVGSEAVTQLLKTVLPRPGGENTLPSGHMTLLGAVALLALLAAPRVRRWLVGVVGGVLVAVGAVATWAIGWHRPSDVIAALGVVALTWGVSNVMLAPGDDSPTDPEPADPHSVEPAEPADARAGAS